MFACVDCNSSAYSADDGMGLGDVVALLVDAGVAVGVCDKGVAWEWSEGLIEILILGCAYRGRCGKAWRWPSGL